jgi:hypothetical protein
MPKLKLVIIATLLAIPASWALHTQTSKPAALTAADYLEMPQLVARYSYAVDMHGGDGSACAALCALDGRLGAQAKGAASRAEFAAKTNMDRSAPAFAQHFVRNVVITPAPDGAPGRSWARRRHVREDAGRLLHQDA